MLVLGFPRPTSKREICDFLHGVKIFNGLKGIHFVSNMNNESGAAFVELVSAKDFYLASKKHREYLGTSRIDGEICFFI